jgi:hypothetical protein
MPKTKLKRKKNFKRTKRQKKYFGGYQSQSESKNLTNLNNQNQYNQNQYNESNESLFSNIRTGIEQSGQILYNTFTNAVSDVGKQISLNVENTLLKSLELIQNPQLKSALKNTIDQLGEKEKEEIAEALNTGLITEAKSLTNAVVSAAAEIPGLNIPIEASRIASSGLQAVEGVVGTAEKLSKISEEVSTNLQENIENIHSDTSNFLEKGIETATNSIPSPTNLVQQKMDSVASKIPTPSNIIDKGLESATAKVPSTNINKLIKQNGGISKRILESINHFENPLENKINNQIKSKGKTKRVRFSL